MVNPAATPQTVGKASLLRILIRSLFRVFAVLGALVFVLGLLVAYAFFVEPHWLCVRRVRLSPSPTARLIHISDVHFKGDRAYLQRVVRVINGLDADAVCFTGDMIETAPFAPGALEILSKINKPLYGVEGNHDQWVIHNFAAFREAFRSTGGDWLDTAPAFLPSKHLAFIPFRARNMPAPPGYKRIILDHYPYDADKMRLPFDVMLAGHTHGGQICIPFLRRPELGRYVRGLYRTAHGPLYVNPGIGTFYISARFRCRPEITVIEL